GGAAGLPIAIVSGRRCTPCRGFWPGRFGFWRLPKQRCRHRVWLRTVLTRQCSHGARRAPSWIDAHCRRGHGGSADGRGREPHSPIRSGGLSRILPKPHGSHRDRTVPCRRKLCAWRCRGTQEPQGDGGPARRHLSICRREGHAGMTALIATDDGAGILAGSRLIHRSLRETPPVAVHGHGIWLVAKDGRKILDASGGAAVSCLGHQHPRVIEALARQAAKLAYAHTSFLSSEPAEALPDQLPPNDP